MTHVDAPDPWIGAKFASSQLRLLVVGESHYDIPEVDLKDLTQYVVRHFAKADSHNAFFTPVTEFQKTSEMFSHMDRPDVWDTIAFANFIARPLRDWRERPVAHDIKQSLSSFRARVLGVQPTHIALFSTIAWNAIPNREGKYRGDNQGTIFEWHVDGKFDALCAKFPHPSHGHLTRTLQSAQASLGLLLQHSQDAHRTF